MHSIRKLVFAGVLSSSCVGCAVMNPYVHPRDENGREPVPKAPDFVGGIGEAVNYADQWRITYRKAAAQHTVMRNTSAAVILPLSAASLFYGITDHGSSDRIARMAIGSAGLYGANQFLTSEPRQTLYLEGAKALTCAIAASRPFMVTKEWRDDLVSDSGALAKSNSTLAASISALKGQIAAAATLPDNETTTAELAIANAAVTAAEQSFAASVRILENATSAVRSVEQSGQNLHASTRSIVDFVNIEIGKTQPDLDALRSIAAGLVGQAEVFGQSYLPQPAETEKPVAHGTPGDGGTVIESALGGLDQAKFDLRISERSLRVFSEKIQGDRALDDEEKDKILKQILDLKAKITRLELQIANLNSRLAVYDSTQDLRNARIKVHDAQALVAEKASIVNVRLVGMDNLAAKAQEVTNCRPTETTVPFTVLPAGDTLSIKKEKAATLTAQGGNLMPRFQLVGVNTDKIKVDQVAQTSSVLVLTITAGKEAVAAAAAPTLVLTDGSGRKSVTVRVVVTD